MSDPGPQVALIGDGSRLHLQHGPIDLIVEADGPDEAVAAARAAAIARFDGLLTELVGELELLRTPLGPGPGARPSPEGAVAARMMAAVEPYRHDHTITPMAAVAGAVADEIGEAIAAAAPLRRWLVNNGGDIALGLAPGASYRAASVVDPRRAELGATITVEGGSGIGGIATSGRHGRSFSLGIADAVTVLAGDAAAADAAATLIANAVDLGPHRAIVRVAARELDPDSDLGDRPVTVDVGPLTTDETERALAGGLATAETLVDRRLIAGALLHLGASVCATASAPSRWSVADPASTPSTGDHP